MLRGAFLGIESMLRERVSAYGFFIASVEEWDRGRFRGGSQSHRVCERLFEPGCMFESGLCQSTLRQGL